MNKNKTIKTLAATTLGVVSLGATFALAADSSQATNNNGQTQNNNSRKHGGHENRFLKTNSDKSLSDRQGFQNLTDAQKTALEQARTLMQQGKQDEAKKVLDSAGIKAPEGKEHIGGNGMHGNMKKVDDAIVARDYATFQSVASNTPLANISQDVFSSLSAPMQAKRNAETAEKSAMDQIQTILKNAGIQMMNMQAR